LIVIVDIDNTLSININRYKIATRDDGSIDWDILYQYDNVLSDVPNYPMIDIVNHLYKNYKIFLFTSRPEIIMKSTIEWLNLHNVLYHKLYMRDIENHYISDVELKKKMYSDFINDTVFCAFDDTQNIIDMWKSEGIPCFKVYAQ
jgi:hypothetical protein